MSQYATILSDPAQYMEIVSRSGKGDAFTTTFYNDVPEKITSGRLCANESEFGKLIPNFSGPEIDESQNSF